MFDAHYHISKQSQDSIIGNPGFVNSIQEDDWQAVSLYAEKNNNVFPFLGIHPWYLHTAAPGWENRLEVFLQQNTVCGIGETGLDAYGQNKLSLEKQIVALQNHGILALKYQKPMVVHIVKAYDLFFSLYKELNFAALPVMVHRFEHSKEILRRFLDCGLYISFQHRLGQKRKLELLAYCPLDRLFLESDNDSGSDQEALKVWYAEAAEYLKITQCELEEQIDINRKKFTSLAETTSL